MVISRSENMSRIRGADTTIELALRKGLKKIGYRFRINDKSVFGKPDIVFKSKKLAVFCDSEFWHGKDYLRSRKLPKTNTAFWKNKIRANIERDKEVNRYLRSHGWQVVRIWAKDIKHNVTRCIVRIEKRFTASNERNNKTARRKSPD